MFNFSVSAPKILFLQYDNSYFFIRQKCFSIGTNREFCAGGVKCCKMFVPAEPFALLILSGSYKPKKITAYLSDSLQRYVRQTSQYVLFCLLVFHLFECSRYPPSMAQSSTLPMMLLSSIYSNFSQCAYLL